MRSDTKTIPRRSFAWTRPWSADILSASGRSPLRFHRKEAVRATRSGGQDARAPADKMKILRIIARLNVGGPARHVIWLTEGLKPDGYETLLVAGVVPPGEDDMSYVAAASGVQPFTLPEMSREISLKDALTIWKLFRLMRRERPDIVHTHTAKAGTVGRVAGLMYRLTPKARRCHFVHTYHG